MQMYLKNQLIDPEISVVSIESTSKYPDKHPNGHSEVPVQSDANHPCSKLINIQ